jgi:predicted dinucleotide-utilizing enzyme
LKRFSDDVRLIGIVDTDQHRERVVRKELGIKRRETLESLINKCDLVVEAACEIGRASCREKCRSRWSPYH